MPLETSLTILLLLFSAALIGVFVARPGITVTRGGKIMAFLVLFVLPILCGAMGISSELERSKTTKFCLSCHIMEPYGQSLRVDDPSYLAAAHFQNHRVPADNACYTCHTNYAMFGSVKAKMAGRPAPYSVEELEGLARHCTGQEDQASRVERQIRKSTAALLLESRKGQQFDAIVTGASAKGTWVRLLHPPAEGRVVRGFAGLDVGDRVRVELVDTDVERGFIDFSLVRGR